MKFVNYKYLVALLFSMVFVGCSFFKQKEFFDRGDVKYRIPMDKIKKVVLDNGFKIFVFERKRSPKVLLQIAYGIGSGVEGADEHGLAHLLEHMIFKGTQKLAEGDIDAIARKYGASFNAFTAKDITSYYFEANKNNWEPFVEILADCMVNARFEQQHLNSELKAVIQELRRDEDDYWRWMYHKASELLYSSNHPYHHPVLGYKEELFNVSADRLSKFYKKYYHPHNAALFVVGDVDSQEVINIATEYFDKLPKVENKIKNRVLEDQLLISSRVNKIYKDIKNDLCGFYWKIPGLKANNKILSEIVGGVLGGREGSILYRRLVDQDKIAMDVSAYPFQLKESGIFFVCVEPRKGSIDKCRDAIKDELSKIINSGISDKVLKKVARVKERDFLQMLESNSSLAGEWIDSYFSTGDEYELFERVKKFYNVTASDVQKFSKEYLDPFFMNELNVLPLPEDKKALWLKNKEHSEKMDADILQKFKRTVPLEKLIAVESMQAPKTLKFSFPKPDRVIELNNGYKVVLKKSGDLPLIYTNLSFKDSSFIGMSKEGRILDVVMGMLIEGSVGFSKNDNVDFFEMNGAAYSFGSTGAILSTVNMGYKNVLQRMFHILTKPDFSEKALDKVKNIFIDSYQRAKDSPSAIAKNLFQTMVYKNHPFGWSFDEAIELVKGLTVKDLQEFHKKYVSPTNMSMAVVGDFDLDEIENDIKNVFHSWKGGNKLKFNFGHGSFVPNEKCDNKMLRDQAILLLGKTSDINIYHKDYNLHKLLNFICFNSLGSYLYQLRERTGLFYSAGGGFSSGATKVHGYDFLWALLSIDKLEVAENKLYALVEKIKNDGIKDSDLQDARQWYLKALIDMVSQNGSIAGTFSFINEYGFDYDYYDKVLLETQTVDLEYMNTICKKYFNTSGFSRIRVGRV